MTTDPAHGIAPAPRLVRPHGPWRRRLTGLAAAAVLASAAWTIVVLLSGGVTFAVGGRVLVTSHDLRPTLGILLASLATSFASGGWSGFTAALEGGWDRLARAATAVAAAVALLIVATGLAYGTHTAGGADSYGYVSQAVLWARGRLVVDVPLAREAPWPDAEWTLSPLGYRPATRPGAIVPVYSPGLPMTLAAARALAGDGALWTVVAILGGLFVWGTYLLGRRVVDARTGLAAAALVASSPVTLFQLVQPMSDVPVAAWWSLALVASAGARRRHGLAAGVATAMAVLTRPNLAPLALAPLVALAWQRDGRPARLAAYVGPVAVAALAVAALNARLYGSPFLSGYGPADYLYQLRNIGPNLYRYATWSYEAHGLVFLLALAAPLALCSRPASARHPGVTAAALVLIALCVASYLPYAVFDTWTYLRFLLPALGPLMVFVAVAFVWFVGRLPEAARLPAWLLILTVVTTVAATRAREFEAFDLRVSEQVYPVAADMARDVGGPDGVYLAMQHGGSLRYYGDVLTLRWDYVDPAWLDRLVAWWQERGRKVYVVLEDWEQTPFRTRFAAHSALGRLDWPPRGEARIGGIVSVYDVADREGFAAGSAIPTKRYYPTRHRR